MKILLIGGTNFIGPAVAEQLTLSEHEVVLFHRNIVPNIQHRQIQGDCNNIDDIGKALEATKPDVIIHTIALCRNQINVLEQALQGKKRRVVILSSIDVYKAYEVFFGLSDASVVPVPFDERAELRDVLYPYRGKLDTDFAYDYEKILVEHAALQSPVVDVIILRLGMVYGRNDPNYRFSEPIQKMYQNVKQIELSKNTADFRASKCYVKDIAHGIKLAAESNIRNEIYNLAALETLTELEWYQEIAKLMDWHGNIVVTQENSTPDNNTNSKQHLIADTTKIRKQLNYKEIFSIREGLNDTIQWELNMLESESYQVVL
ncbi:MAG: NAD-dependent epimerase/dehydratase family protein [Planctomycetaceae bacterium]|jgi:nucleoside-diphosphate-sugar epimerase|nr:NAD-dependent epimerase/dehydratase family protein [Planctomycetaceae bacterium]